MNRRKMRIVSRYFEKVERVCARKNKKMKQEKNCKTKWKSIGKGVKINKNNIKNNNCKSISKGDKKTRSTSGRRATAGKYYKEISTKYLQNILKRCFVEDHIISKILIKPLLSSFLLSSPCTHKGEKRRLTKRRMLPNQLGGKSWRIKEILVLFQIWETLKKNTYLHIYKKWPKHLFHT